MTKIFPLTTLVLVLLFSPLALSGPTKKVPLPKEKEFKRSLVRVMKSYPTDGTHRYYWPRGKSKGYAGTTRDLIYEKKIIAKGDPKKRCYCCGLTFEVFFRAYKVYCKKNNYPFRIGNLTPRKLKKMRSHWYVATKDRSGCQGAIVKYKVGRAIKNLYRARTGDFVQFWRKNGSGHSVIFLNWIFRGRKIIGMRYWSTQKSTRGIGVKVEKIYGSSGIDLEKVYIGRIGRKK